MARTASRWEVSFGEGNDQILLMIVAAASCERKTTQVETQATDNMCYLVEGRFLE